MLKNGPVRVTSVVCLLLVASLEAQSDFTWQNQSIGGGGFCMEVRFDPYDLTTSSWEDPALYLATDVSGVYRSDNLGNSWQHLWDPDATQEKDVLARYATTIAFSKSSQRIVIGTNEGIYYRPAAGGDWVAASLLPERGAPGLAGMSTGDGRFPWVGIIREYPLMKSDSMLAGIGDVRDTQFGLGCLLRSTDGGVNWDLVPIDGAASTEIVYDVDFVTCTPNNRVHTFITTGGSPAYGAVYYSDNMFEPSFNNGEAVRFVKMTTKVNGAVEDPLTNLVSLVLLCSSVLPNPIPTSSTIHAYLTHFAPTNDDPSAPGGVYRAATSLDELGSLILNPNVASFQPNWEMKHRDNGLGRLCAEPGSVRTNFQLYLGTHAGEQIYLAVTTNALARGNNILRRIVSPNVTSEQGPHDPGYRELAGFNTQLKLAASTSIPRIHSSSPRSMVAGATGR